MSTVGRLFKNNIRQYGMVIALAAIMIFFQALTGGIMFKPMNITNLVLQNSYVMILAIGMLLVFHSPVLVVAGFVPLFFDNATLGVYANNKGGLKACLICPFICGLLQVFGSALIASWVGMAAYGGYLGMFDWATVWPLFTVIMKYLGYAGIAVVAIFLIVIPQLQYKAAPKDENGESAYFLEVEDWDKYKELRDERDAKTDSAA